jgi:LysR family hydrogen peroxide-inducible transcriptional activator
MSPQPTIKQLKYLSALAEHRHFGRAALACHVSQSTLSAAIQELEDILDSSLVDRSSKQLQLTSLGDEVLRRGRNILTAVEDLVDVTRLASAPLSTSLRLGVIPTVAPFLLPGLIKQLWRKHPGFKLFIREDLSGHLLSALHQGDLDLLLLALPYPAQHVDAEHLFYDRFVLGYSHNSKLDRAKQASTLDLKGEELLLLEDGHCLRDHALEACQLNPQDVNIPYQGTSLNTIVQMVANGIGVTLLPQMAIDGRILSGTSVKSLPFKDSKVGRSIGLMWRKQNPRQEEFQLLGEYIKQLGPKESKP